MSRDETIMALVRNGGGQYSGEMDYSIQSAKFDALNLADLESSRALLLELVQKVEENIEKRGGKTSLRYRIWKVVDLRYFPAFKKNYKMWPISFSYGTGYGMKKTPPLICAHGWQVGYKNGKAVYGWTLHIGEFKIKFGKTSR
jgi:hypothetical protein